MSTPLNILLTGRAHIVILWKCFIMMSYSNGHPHCPPPLAWLISYPRCSWSHTKVKLEDMIAPLYLPDGKWCSYCMSIKSMLWKAESHPPINFYTKLWNAIINPHVLCRMGEWVIKFNGLSGDSGHRGPYSPYKPCNHSLYIGIIIFPHIDNPQSTGHNFL